MRTEAWIDALAAQVTPVDPRAPRRRLVLAAAAGFAAALPLVLWRLGVNAELASDLRLPEAWLKWGFVLAVIAGSGWLVTGLSRPGQRAVPALWLLGVALLLLWGAAGVQLGSVAAPQRMALLLGSSWRTCPLAIALLSLPALLVLLAAVRSLAPTRPAAAGAATGLFAGAVATLAYLAHCAEMAAPFVGTWYVLGMLVPAALGALLGPQLLRW